MCVEVKFVRQRAIAVGQRQPAPSPVAMLLHFVHITCLRYTCCWICPWDDAPPKVLIAWLVGRSSLERMIPDRGKYAWHEHEQASSKGEWEFKLFPTNYVIEVNSTFLVWPSGSCSMSIYISLNRPEIIRQKRRTQSYLINHLLIYS